MKQAAEHGAQAQADAHGHDDFEMEPVPGLPGHLPDGETLVWQGKPHWWGIALRVFHIRKVFVYFCLLISWRGITAIYDGEEGGAALAGMLNFTGASIAGLVLLAVLAKLYARTTIYTITSKRVVIRFGVALSMAVNFPFAKVSGAALRTCPDGTGDIPLTTLGRDKIAYLHLWPFARPGRYRQPEPMLRAVKEPERVAELLSKALEAEIGKKVTEVNAGVSDAAQTAEESAARPAHPGLKPDLVAAE